MLVSEEQLMDWTGYQTAGYVESWLIRNGIKYLRGNHGRLITTEEAINEALKYNVGKDNIRRTTFAKTG